MALLKILSFNCHGYNAGTLQYLREKCLDFDILLLQETWLSNNTSYKLDDVSSDFIILHSSAMESKIDADYLSGRPFGGTALLYNKHLPCPVSTLTTNTPRCTAIKIMIEGHRDLVVVSVYMPFLSGSMDQRLEYESTIGCLQGIVDKNIGCDFVFGGDLNVSKSQVNVCAASVDNFCCSNNMLWLDSVKNDISYTYHSDTNGHFSFIDHMLVSPSLVHSQQSVVIHVDDYNASDHYAISTAVNIDFNGSTKNSHVKNERMKYLWNRGDVNEYASVLSKELSKIVLPTSALRCDGSCEYYCTHMIDQYYQDIVQCLLMASNSCIPVKNLRREKHWWNEELDELKQQAIDATQLWRSVGCPRSGAINLNRLQCKYKYKHAIKQAIMNADQEFNEELFNYFAAKEDDAFWRSWRKRYCSSSLKATNTLNGKHGDKNICTEFTAEFCSVFQTNTPNSDLCFKAELQDHLQLNNEDAHVPLVDVEMLSRCLSKMKINKSPGFDNISAEHLIYSGSDLQVHLCLFFNLLLLHRYVPCEFAYGIIIPLLKDKHGDQTKLDMYRGITLSPTIAKLFEYVLLEFYEGQLSSDDLQFGFKKHSGCSHALFTFKQTTKYFISKGSKVYCAFLDASKAFDKVLHNGLFLKLLKKNVSPGFVRLLQNWYSKLHASVLWNGVIGPVFTVHCGVRQGGILSPLLFAIYIDDLLQELRISGYGVHIGSLFVGAVAYADDICILSCSCYGLQKLLDICSEYGIKWDIRFNPVKSQLMTFGGNNPVNTVVSLGDKVVQWVSKVKYLGMYLIGGNGKEMKIDFNVAKRKYYGCFNTIKSSVGSQANEIMVLHLVKTYCLPRLLYGCEMWPLASVNMHELDVVWNNGFRHIFNCFWRESVKPLQYYCNSLPLSYMVEERQLLFCRKLFYSNNRILRALIALPVVQYEFLGLATKYGINALNYSIVSVKSAIWSKFASSVVF